MKTFEIIETENGIIEGVKLNTGETFNTINEIVEWSKENKEFAYGENLHCLMIALESKNVKMRVLSTLKNGLTARLKVGKTTYVEMKSWNLDLKADERSMNIIEDMNEKYEYITSSPAAEVNNSFTKAMGYEEAAKRTKWAPNTLEGYLSSSKYPSIGFRPAYSGGTLVSSANPWKIYENVKSYDINSAYPYAALTAKVPISKSIILSDEEIKQLNIKEDGSLNIPEEQGFIGLFRFQKVFRKAWVKAPFLKKDDAEWTVDAEFDDLGLLESEEATLALCPNDLKLFHMQYGYTEARIIKLSIHQLGEIPMKAKEFIKKAYLNKKEQAKGSVERETAKTALNTIVGFWGTDSFATMIKKSFEDGVVINEYEGDLNEHFKRYSGEGSKVGRTAGKIRTWDFRWAVYVLAETRMRLAKAEWLLFQEGQEVLYVDTDCIKINGNTKTIQEVFEFLNKGVLDALDFHGIGLWTDESEDYSRAVFRGAKVYFHENDKGERFNVVSGVEKCAAGRFDAYSLEELSSVEQEITVEITRRMPMKVKNSKFGADTVYAKQNLKITY